MGILTSVHPFTDAMSAHVAINPSPSIPSTGTPAFDAGIGMTLALFAGTILKTLFDRGLHVFEQKDQSEAELTTALINDIRTANQSMSATLPHIKTLIEQNNQIAQSLKTTIDQFSGTYQLEIQQIRRANTELIVEMRAQQAAILKRLDQLQEVR